MSSLPNMHDALLAFRDAAAPLGLCSAEHDPAPVGGLHPPPGDLKAEACRRG